MQPDESWQTGRVASRSIAALLLFSLAACVPPPAPVAAVAAPPPQDPVLAFVSTGRIGQSGLVNDPSQGGDVTVVIGTQYNAASGNICRTYATTASGAQAQHLACGEGTDWQEIPPLAANTN